MPRSTEFCVKARMHGQRKGELFICVLSPGAVLREEAKVLIDDSMTCPRSSSQWAAEHGIKPCPVGQPPCHSFCMAVRTTAIFSLVGQCGSWICPVSLAQIPSTPNHSSQSECPVKSVLSDAFPENIPAQMSFPAVDDVALIPGLGAFSLGSTLGHVLGSSRQARGSSRRDVLVGVFLVPLQLEWVRQRRWPRQGQRLGELCGC